MVGTGIYTEYSTRIIYKCVILTDFFGNNCIFMFRYYLKYFIKYGMNMNFGDALSFIPSYDARELRDSGLQVVYLPAASYSRLD